MTHGEALKEIAKHERCTLVIVRATGEITEVVGCDVYDRRKNWETWNDFRASQWPVGKTTHEIIPKTTEEDLIRITEKIQIIHAKIQLEKAILYEEYHGFGYTLVLRNDGYFIYTKRTLPSAEGALPGKSSYSLHIINGRLAKNLPPQELAAMGVEANELDLIFKEQLEMTHRVKKRVFSSFYGELRLGGKPGCGDDFPHYSEGKFPIVLL